MNLELRIPPVVLLLLFGLAMYGVSRAFPEANLAIPFRLWLACLCAALGVFVTVAGLAAFRRHATSVNPMAPEQATTLVSGGIYRFSRNPMYLGFFLVLAAWCLYRANWAAAILLPVFVIYMNCFQIRPEERALEARFTAAFTQYAGAVRRWI